MQLVTMASMMHCRRSFIIMFQRSFTIQLYWIIGWYKLSRQVHRTNYNVLIYIIWALNLSYSISFSQHTSKNEGGPMNTQHNHPLMDSIENEYTKGSYTLQVIGPFLQVNNRRQKNLAATLFEFCVFCISILWFVILPLISKVSILDFEHTCTFLVKSAIVVCYNWAWCDIRTSF